MATTRPHDAFISYSHADERLAAALEQGLERLAKPWYRRRALSVMLDRTGLAVNPALWAAIRSELDRARFLIVIASPAAAASHWVGREVEHWLAAHGADQLLLVLAAGDCVWDAEHDRFDAARSDGIPASLRDAFSEEPRLLDVRWAADVESLDLDDPRFRDAVAELAAPLHERTKDDLVGEDLRQHRRTIRLARGAVALLSALLLGVLIAAVIAMGQAARADRQADRARANADQARRNAQTATEQRDRATEQARLASSHGLAGQAVANLAARPEVALLLAAEALRTAPTFEARSAAIAAIERRGARRFEFRRDASLGSAPVAFRPDGRRLAVGGAGTRRYELPSGRPVSPDVGGTEPAGGVLAYSPDGHVLATNVTGGIALVDDTTGTELRRLRTDDFLVDAAFSADGGTISTVSSVGVIRRWDADTGRPVARPFGGRDEITLSVLSADGRLAAATGGLGPPVVWDVDARRRLPALPVADVDAMAFSADGRLLATQTSRGAIDVWRVRDRHRIARLAPPGSERAGFSLLVAFSRDGSLLGAVTATSGSGRQLQIWRIADGVPLGEPEPVPPAADLAFAPDGRTLAVGHDGTATLFVVQPQLALAGTPPSTTQALAFSADGGRLAAGGTDLSVFDLHTSPPTTTALRRNALPYYDVEFTPRGELVAAGIGSRIEVWDVDRRRLLRGLLGHGEVVWDVDVSPDGAWLASSSLDGTVRRWSLTGVARNDVALALQADPRGVSFDPEGGGLIAATYEHPEPGTSAAHLLRVPAASQGPRADVVITADAEHVIASGDHRVLALTGGGVVRMVDRQTLQPTGLPIAGPGGLLRGLALDRTGAMLVTAADREVQLWDVGSRRPLGDPVRMPGVAVPTAAAFSPDGSRLAIATGPGRVDGPWQLWLLDLAPWNADSSGLDARLCEAVGRNLSRLEWQEFLADRPYEATCPTWSSDG